MKTRLAPWLFALTLLAPLSACKKTEAETTPPDGHAHGEDHDEKHHEGNFEGREVVSNWEAKTGDVTVCPMSGKKFEVADGSDRFDYQGHNFVFCCANCLDKVSADPGKYLDPLVEEAGGAVETEAAPVEAE